MPTYKIKPAAIRLTRPSKNKGKWHNIQYMMFIRMVKSSFIFHNTSKELLPVSKTLGNEPMVSEPYQINKKKAGHNYLK
jgi:hypothetical protein